MAHTLFASRPIWQRAGIWTLQLLGAVAFLAAGGAKLAGAESMVATFAQIGDQLGTGQWFRVLTGALEVLGGGLLLLPALATWGGGLLACVMVGAVFTHVVLIGGSFVPAMVLLTVVTSVAWLRRNEAAGLARGGLAA